MRPSHRSNPRGLTLTEVMAVIGIIVVLLAILLPGLATIRKAGEQTVSESSLRQIFTYFKSYSTDNREFIVPSSFDYRQSSYPGKVRTNSPRSAQPYMEPLDGGVFAPGAPQHVGSWADILWTYSDQAPILDVQGPPNTVTGTEYNYRYDSPDRWVFESRPGFNTVFRSAAPNTRAVGGNAATPFGSGTVDEERGQPGYFAANDWFRVGANATSDNWYSTPQIKFPAKAVYIVDSYAGETIAPNEEGWGSPTSASFPTRVDFRYVGDNALFLTLDGGIKAEPDFADIDDVIDRGYRISNLTSRGQ